MMHEVLGEIRLEDDSSPDGIATVRFGSREVRIQIVPDGEPFDTTVRRAAEVALRLGDLERAAKHIASAELREQYNNGWNKFQQIQADGSWRDVCLPQLSEAEFEEKLTLNGITIIGDQLIEIFFDDGRMFWGHSVIVTSFDGLEFRDTHAELFG